MQAEQIVTHRIPTTQERQFIVAFIPLTQRNITQAWSLKASEAIRTLIDFRSAIHRWQANGVVNETEFIAGVQALEDAGLQGFVDELMVAGIEALL